MMRRRQLHIVEPMLFGYMFCVYLSSPVEQQLIYRKVCLQEFKNETICDIINQSNNVSITGQNIVQKNSANWGIYLDIARSLPALVITLFYGAISDRLGRKVVMILPVIGDLSNIAFQLINSYFMDWHVGYLLFGVMFSACFGGFACFLSAVFAYVADLTDKTARTKRVILLEAMIYLGGIISNLTGGLLLDRYGFIAVYSLMICIYGLQILYWIFLSESHSLISDDNNSSARTFFKSLFNLDRIRESWKVVRNAAKPLQMYLYFSCFSLSVSLFVSINSISVLYLFHHPLDFVPSEIGYFFAEYNAVKFIGSMSLNWLLIKMLHWEDYSMIFLSGIFYAGYALSMSAVTNHTQTFLAVLFAFGCGIATPAARSGLSKLVLPTEQGRIFSIIAIVEVIVVTSASPLAKYIYEVSVDVSPSLVYYVMAACSVFIFLFSSLLKFVHHKDRYNELQEDCIINS